MNRFIDWEGHPWISLPLRIYIGGLFLYACYHKILNPASFALDVATYQILPLYLVNLTAIILPWVELSAGLMILVGWRTRAASLLIAGMLTMFLVAIIIALSKGFDMSCGCFASQGMEEDPISIRTVIRDAGLLLITLYVFFFDKQPIGIDRFIRNMVQGSKLKIS